ncbi:MAG: hypothetical protein GPOALKHO_001676 [Sodalis sp.]|nr:MAG: hypothetical protein GPOALKHO_001676 [Sodalis sp.]
MCLVIVGGRHAVWRLFRHGLLDDWPAVSAILGFMLPALVSALVGLWLVSIPMTFWVRRQLSGSVAVVVTGGER